MRQHFIEQLAKQIAVAKAAMPIVGISGVIGTSSLRPKLKNLESIFVKSRETEAPSLVSKVGIYLPSRRYAFYLT